MYFLHLFFSRVIDAHAASTSDNHHLTTASIDLIAYAWVSPGQEIFSLPTTFNIPFNVSVQILIERSNFYFQDFFDLIMPDETPIVGLTDNELDRIPTMIYTSKTSNDNCAVCLNEYNNGDKLKYLKCQHYFHSECIDPWLKVKLSISTLKSDFCFVLDIHSLSDLSR
jgi:hypothetical protein